METSAEYFLILSGDQVYNIDFKEMVHFAKETNADVVVACLPINENKTEHMGILGIDDRQFIISFIEKPKTKKELKSFRLNTKQEKKLNLDPQQNLSFIGSMGIYLFKRQV